MPLEMKYFVLKPKSKTWDDPYGVAARQALRAYANAIEDFDPELCGALTAWADVERDIATQLPKK